MRAYLFNVITIIIWKNTNFLTFQIVFIEKFVSFVFHKSVFLVFVEFEMSKLID